MVTAYTTQYKAQKRYTVCPECQHELYSPQHDMYHEIWEKQQIAKLSNVLIQGDEKSIIVESMWNGKKYRGVMYLVKEERNEIQ